MSLELIQGSTPCKMCRAEMMVRLSILIGRNEKEMRKVEGDNKLPLLCRPTNTQVIKEEEMDC